MIDPKDCPPDQPYEGTYKGMRWTMQRNDPGDSLQWGLLGNCGNWAYAMDDHVSDLVPLVPAAPRTVSTVDYFQALPQGSVVVIDGDAYQRRVSGWCAADYVDEAAPSHELAELVEDYGPAYVVWTPDWRPVEDPERASDPGCDSRCDSKPASDQGKETDCTPAATFDLSWITAEPLPEVRRDRPGQSWRADGKSIGYEYFSLAKVERTARVMVAMRAVMVAEQTAGVEARARTLFSVAHPDADWGHLEADEREPWKRLADPDELHRIADMNGGDDA